MPTTYCELNESFHTKFGLPKYVTYSSSERWFSHGRHGYNIMHNSDRAWVQYDDDNSTVSWAKNRFDDPDTSIVDMKEFMLVKLKSKTI